MKKSFVVFVLFFVGCGLQAQIPVQIFAGHKAVEYDFFWDKNIDSEEKFNLFNFTSFRVQYDNNEYNAYEILTLATYNLSPKWGLSAGANFTDGHLNPQIAISYQLETEKFYMNVFPSVHYFSGTNSFGYGLFGLAFYHPQLNNVWYFYSQLLFEPLFDGFGHIYSYQQLRVGLDYQGLFQFGLGATFEQFGGDFSGRQNFGVFARRELF